MGTHEGHHTTKATFGGGCFWCLEAVFKLLPGVEKVVNGYAGGTVPNPAYEQVCEGNTGHAEVIQVTYDPMRIRYDELLEVFWDAHDPTTLNRQGADVGTQYRSVIFFHDDNQRQIAEQSCLRAQSRFTWPIVTEVLPLTEFYPAEDYHQDYFAKNPHNPYCGVVIRPKVEKIQEKLAVR